uniref:G-protein coupled receptors family 1 profile domain-containing protein n=1 Tax=Chrysemys picta bellii TaxID=8478 RepID=A0A8C3HGX4_CHRPI
MCGGCRFQEGIRVQEAAQGCGAEGFRLQEGVRVQDGVPTWGRSLGCGIRPGAPAGPRAKAVISPQLSSNATSPVANNSTTPTSNVLAHISVAIFVVSFLLGMVGNGLVIWVTCFRMRRTVNSIWFLSLALADLLYSLLLPFYAAKTAASNQWAFGNFLCKAVGALLFLSMFASVFQLTLISVDRSLLVARPVWAQRFRTPRLAWGAAAVAWLLAGAFSAPYLVFLQVTCRGKRCFCVNNFGDEVTRMARQQALIVVRFVAGFLAPLLVITACHVVVMLRAGHRGRRPNRTAKVVAAVVLSFFFCWLPYHVFNFLHRSPSNRAAFKVGSSLAFSLTCLGCFLNPLLYAFLGRRFQEGLRGSSRARCASWEPMGHGGAMHAGIPWATLEQCMLGPQSLARTQCMLGAYGSHCRGACWELLPSLATPEQ